MKKSAFYLDVIQVIWKENRTMQPCEGRCPKCNILIYCDPAQVTIICPECGLPLVRGDWDEDKLFVK